MSGLVKLFLYLLGKPEVKREGVPVTGFAQQKSLALLAYLAVTGRSHTRATLAGLLWGESSEANARANLRKVLADLRGQVAAHLTITHHDVAFNESVPYWLDIQVFEQQVTDIQQLYNPNTVLMPETAAVLADVVKLYRGDFLAGFHVRRAPAFEEWVLLQRERLRLIALQALHRLTAYYMARGLYTQAVGSIERLLALEPCQEDAHRQLISILALHGQREAALRQYQICCRALDETLGVTPQEETTALYERIRNGRTQKQTGNPSPSLPASPLIGRDKETADILAWLRNPECRLLTLIGPGGSGKTRLAQEIAARLGPPLRAETRDIENTANADAWEVALIPCASVQSAIALVPAIAHSVKFYFSQAGDSRQQLLDYLRSKRMVLILDNFEHLLTPKAYAVNVIREILDTAPAIKILVTSRMRLNIQAEHLYAIQGLSLPQQDGGTPSLENAQATDAVQLREYGAIQLFLWNMQRVQASITPSDRDLSHIIRICKFLQGMPLAILLAASWTRMLFPAEIEAQLLGTLTDTSHDTTTRSDALDFLTTDRLDLPVGQRSMRAVFDHSWQLLAAQERQILAALSVFRGGFTYEAAQRVCSATLHSLVSLVDQSLLHRTASGRYELHDLLWHYAREKLAGVAGQVKVIRDQHSRYFAAALQQWAADLETGRQHRTLAEMEGEIANLRAAWDWAAARGLWAQIDQAMDGLCGFYEWRNRLQEGEAACQTIVAQAANVPSPTLDRQAGLRAKIMARILVWQSKFSKAEAVTPLLQESQRFLEKAQQAGEEVHSERALILLRLGLAVTGDSRLCEQSLLLYQQLGNRWGEAQALDAMGWLAWSSGNYAEAEQLYRKGLTIYQDLGDQKGIAVSSLFLGIAMLFQGRSEGEMMLREGLAIYEEVGDHAAMAAGWYYAGIGLMSLGHFVEAHTFLERSVHTYQDLGIVEHTANIFLGGAKVHLGQYEQGRSLAQIGLDLARARDDQAAIGYALIVLGWVALIRENYAEALRLFQESTERCRSIEQKDMISWGLTFMGYTYCRLNQLTQASQRLHQALEIAEEIQSFVAYKFILSGVALFMIKLREERRAIEFYALASRYPMIANSRWFADTVGQYIAALTNTLPPNIVARAKEEGRAHDLDKTITALLVELPRLAT